MNNSKKGYVIAIPREAFPVLDTFNDNTKQLAIYLSAHIDSRCEVYLDMEHASRALCVSDSTIRRSMNKLVQRRLLVPTNKKNTYVFGYEMATTHRVDLQ